MGLFGGTKINIPGPSAAETALMNMQISSLMKQGTALDEQQRLNDLLAPFMFEASGLKPLYGDVSGKDAFISNLQSRLRSGAQGLTGMEVTAPELDKVWKATGLEDWSPNTAPQIPDLLDQIKGKDLEG